MALSLVFSTGGVAIVGHAGSSAEGSTSEADSDPQQSVVPVEATECEAPPGFHRTAPRKTQVLEDAAGNKSIVLNTSGYNYVLEGEWRPDPVAKPVGVPEGVLPDDIGATTPAAPAKK